MVISSSNLVKILTVRGETRDTLSRSVGQVEVWWTLSISNAKINSKYLQIAEISFPIRNPGPGIEFRCQNFHRKLTKSRFYVHSL